MIGHHSGGRGPLHGHAPIGFHRHHGASHRPLAHGPAWRHSPFALHPGFGPPRGAFAGHRLEHSPFNRIDADHDGKITKDEVMSVFTKVDQNQDGTITKDEVLKSVQAAHSAGRAHGPQGGASSNAKLPERSAGKPEHRSGRPTPPPFGPGGFRHGPAGRQGPPSPSALFERFDTSKDGKLSRSEVPAFLWTRISKADANNDGEVTKDEFDAHMTTIRPDGTSKQQEPSTEKKPETDKKESDSKAT